MNHPDTDDAWPVIFSYTRRQAIEDGVLVDLTEWARETGFKVPVACTQTVWSSCLVPSDEAEQLGQSTRGRAHDLLWMLFHACCHAGEAEQVQFEVLFTSADAPEGEPVLTTLKALIGPGDEGEPVLTVLFPDED